LDSNSQAANALNNSSAFKKKTHIITVLFTKITKTFGWFPIDAHVESKAAGAGLTWLDPMFRSGLGCQSRKKNNRTFTINKMDG
jgi:hypothetical protein